MNESIESIWKNGFANEKLSVPKIERLYNQKSMGYVEKAIKAFKSEVIMLIPVAIAVFLFNIWLDNDNPVFWGAIGSAPCFIWFFLGKSQLRSLMKIDYQSNSYDYLVSVKAKLLAIHKFNKRLSIVSVPVILFPMLVYTYFNQAGKTIGEIFGVDGLNLPTVAIFLILPVFTLAIAIVAELMFKRTETKTLGGIDNLIHEMEELRK